MTIKLRLRVAVGVLALAASATPARADDAVTLAATDFTLTLSRVDASGTETVLNEADLRTYFSLARCACPTSVVAGLTLLPDAAARLGTHAVDAQLVVGGDCDDAAASGCKAVGAALTLSATRRSTTQSLTTAAVFTAAGVSDCARASTSSTRLWAVVRLDGSRLTTQPSLALTLGGAGPKPPTAVKLQTAEEGLLVTWTATGDSTTLQGHQVLCSPGPAKTRDARFDTCPATTPDGGAGPFATLDAQLVCSDLVAAGTNQVRVHGLENGRAYDVAVVAVGVDGTPSAPSTAAHGTPGPTYGFQELYEAHGGTGEGGCAVAGAGAGPTGCAALALGLCVALTRGGRRRRGRVRVLRALRGLRVLSAAATFFVLALSASRARADSPSSLPESLAAPAEEAPSAESPHTWNLELRFGPYRPDVDSEFADRGSDARPFEEVFSSSRRLMVGLELDRQLVHRAGTWSLGLSAGFYRATAAALAADLKTRSGDETALRLVPLSAALVYRADQLRQRFKSPLVPYAKAGLDCTLWRASDTSGAGTSGRTFGWHAAAGLTLDLSIIDPDAGTTMDRETGINQTALFFEVTRHRLDSFGSDTALRVGDTTWFAGLMFEL